jgi:glutathione peroxidase
MPQWQDSNPTVATENAMNSLYDFSATDITGHPQTLADYAGKVVLVVNTASACGFTPQLEGLQQLHQRYADQGLVVVGFPCNQFGQQDKGSDSEISQFCQRNYGVDFPMMSKIDVNGAQAHPLFRWLKAQAPGLFGTEMIKWNFTKFLVGRNGQVLQRYAPKTAPGQLATDIEQALQAAPAASAA